MTVTFDFDSTLSRKDVQNYASELIARGVDVWVLTSRYDDNHRHRYPSNPNNGDLYAVTDKLGIPRGKIRFQNMRPKAEYLLNTNIVWHLDDDDDELQLIFLETKVEPISVEHFKWKIYCDHYLAIATLK